MKKQISIFFTIILVIICFLTDGCVSLQKDSGENSNIKLDEKYYQTKMCKELKGEIEHVLHDKARVDCLTNEYAIEVDFAKKWAEGIGQALYYAQMTGRKPAVALILDDNEEHYLKRLKTVAKEHKIKIIILKK